MRVEALLARILLVLLASLTGLALVEIGSRLLWGSPSDALVTTPLPRPEPYVMFGFDGRMPDLNRLGYRGPAPSMPKPPAEIRIFLLGGSTVFYGDPPIAPLLEEDLRRDGLVGARVYNFGIPASVSGMELARVTFEVADFQPDIVVLYDGGNDVALPFVADPRPGYPPNFFVYESNPLMDPARFPIVMLLAQRSSFLRHHFAKAFAERFLGLNRLRDAAGWRTAAWRDEIARVYVGNLVKAARVARGVGADFLGFFQPLVYFKHSLSPEEQSYVTTSESAMPGMRDHCLAVRERVRAALSDAPPDVRASLFDLSTIYDETAAPVFADFIHTHQAARPPVARAIADAIRGRRGTLLRSPEVGLAPSPDDVRSP